MQSQEGLSQTHGGALWCWDTLQGWPILQQKLQAFISLHCKDIRCKLPLKRRHDFGGGNSWLRAMRGVGHSCNQF